MWQCQPTEGLGAGLVLASASTAALRVGSRFRGRGLAAAARGISAAASLGFASGQPLGSLREGADGAAGPSEPQMQLDDAPAAGACAAAARIDRGQWTWQMMEAMQKATRPTAEEDAYVCVLAPTAPGISRRLERPLLDTRLGAACLISAQLFKAPSLLYSQAGPVDGLHTFALYLISQGHSPTESSRPSCLCRTPRISSLDTCR